MPVNGDDKTMNPPVTTVPVLTDVRIQLANDAGIGAGFSPDNLGLPSTLHVLPVWSVNVTVNERMPKDVSSDTPQT